MVAHVCNLGVGDFIHTIGDAHIYTNHLEQVKEMLSRSEKDLPTINIMRPVESIFDFRYEDFELIGYNPNPTIKAEVAV
ncbi:MAG: hypothetical protein BEN19_07690 [Epulopiscium sp. Nuni2H_MBin003]|nr:MAG: hypothetical protein BEN19_07690 [Epulopiscium sp. Nuni2H_MBin003]